MMRVARPDRADPCSSPGTTFQRGIATQLVPSCFRCCDVCDEAGVGNPNWVVLPDGHFDRTGWIKGWIVNQLSTRAAVTCVEQPALDRRRAGGWWADAFRTGAAFVSGSKLWSLQWSRSVNETLLTAQRYAEEALAPLITWGIASSVKVEARYVSKSVMTLTVTVTGPSLEAAATLQGQALPDYTWLWRADAEATR